MEKSERLSIRKNVDSFSFLCDLLKITTGSPPTFRMTYLKKAEQVAKDIFLRIAEISIGLTSDLTGTKIQLTGATQKFLIEDAIPDMKIRVLWDELREAPRGRELFDSGSSWKLYDLGGYLLIRLTAPVFGSMPYKEAIFSTDFSSWRDPFAPPLLFRGATFGSPGVSAG